MAIRIIKNIPNFWLRPLQFENTAMMPNVLLMCKMLVILLLAHHLIEKIDDPFIPFIPALDVFHSFPNVFQFVMRSFLVISILTLFFNFYVRTSSLIIGSIVIIHMLASKPGFSNHTFICGCALFLAGLTDKKHPPYLIFIQLSVIYIGASINKMMDMHWWSGDFMHTWLGVARENPFYINFSNFLPDQWLAKVLSWSAIITEFTIAILLLFKRTRKFAIWFIIIFHTLLFTMTSYRFGHFLESLIIILIAFSLWPKSDMIVKHNPNDYSLYKKIMRFLDWDKKIIWKATSKVNALHYRLEVDENIYIGDIAIKKTILFLPAFYILLLVIDMGLYIVLYNHRNLLFILNVMAVWSLIIYFLPIPWTKFIAKKPQSTL